MLTRTLRLRVWILFAVFFATSAVLGDVFVQPGHAAYLQASAAESATSPDPHDVAAAHTVLARTPFQALMPTLLGVREVVASIMWVRADDYFHRGEYKPILQMIREITLIDPHQLDVYATGAWHMAYNFMDKRLIEDGVTFLEEGCRNNPTVYDLFFELGYMHYDKTKDFGQAVKWYSEATEKGTTTGKKDPPAFVRHQLAHAMEKEGDIDGAIRQWQQNLALSEEEEKTAGPHSYATPGGPNTDAARHNLYITRRRLNERLAALQERAGDAQGALQLWERNVALAQDFLKEIPHHPNVTKDLQVAQVQVDRLRKGHLYPVKPTDLELKFTVTRLDSRRVQVEGTCNALDLSRVQVRLEDQDYLQRSRSFAKKMDECTLEYDNVPVAQHKFKKVFELDKDPADMDRPAPEIYPLKADQYVLTVSYNPRLQAEFIQDVYGWDGEGLTARPGMLHVDPQLAGTLMGKRHPLRTVETSITLKRSDLLNHGRRLLAVVQ